MRRLFDRGRPAWQVQLLSREMAHPTPAFDLLVDSSVRPQFALLTGILTDLLPKGASKREAELCARSVLGQCLFYHFCKPVLERLDGEAIDQPARLKQFAAHIVKFTLAALHDLNRTKKK
jgi:TetR/AcrR family transcriptional regulator, regulator of cefoperazone and chloramphenicol sensitivity